MSTVRYGLNDLGLIEVNLRIRAVPELRQSLACNCGDAGSIPGHLIWVVRWSKWH